jgi:hypothetical protein
MLNYDEGSQPYGAGSINFDPDHRVNRTLMMFNLIRIAAFKIKVPGTTHIGIMNWSPAV